MRCRGPRPSSLPAASGRTRTDRAGTTDDRAPHQGGTVPDGEKPRQFRLHGDPFALGAMAVAARVVSDPAVAATLAALDMSAEGGRAAVLDGRHHLELAEAHMPGIDLAPGGAMVMKDVGDLQPRAAHRRRLDPLPRFL